MLNEKDPVYSPFLSENSFFTHCFFTGVPINPLTELVQIIPPWVIEKYGLQKESLTLHTGQRLYYEDIKLPVSARCRANGVDYLLKLVGDLFQAGFTGLNWITDEKITRWLGLLYAGIVMHEFEQFKLMPSAENSLFGHAEVINKHYLFSLTLQTVVRKVSFEQFSPASLFKFQSHDYAGKGGFQLNIAANTLSIYLRIGDMALMAPLFDNHTQQLFFDDYFKPYTQYALHPVQLTEIFSRICYKNLLLQPVFEYALQFPEPLEPVLSIQFHVADANKQAEIFSAWNDLAYVDELARFMQFHGIPKSELFHPEFGVATYLTNDKGRPLVLDAGGNELA